MANKYHIYTGGTRDAKTGSYRGGILVATFGNEEAAFFHEKKLQWDRVEGIYMLCEGDERFKIVATGDKDLPYSITDIRTGRYCYGLCTSREDAIEGKEWNEKYHYEGGKYMDDYYAQFD